MREPAAAPAFRSHTLGAVLFAFLLSSLPLFPAGYSRAEQIMDSADTLIVAERSAFDRVQKGYFLDALSAEQEALKTSQDRLGPTHPGLAPVLSDLATIDRYLARYADAEAALQWGLALRQKAFGPDDPRVADSCRQLAALYDDWGKWPAAEFWAQKAVDILGKRPDSPVEVEGHCEALNLLGRVEGTLGKNAEASSLFQQSLRLQEKSGSNPALRIETLDSLAGARSAAGRFSDARSLLQKALDIAAKSFAASSVAVADAMERLADFDLSQKKPEKARTLYRSALKIYQGFVGVYFGYSTLPYLQRLAKAYQSVGDDKSAADLLEKTLKTTRDVFGPRHPQTALALIQLAEVEKTSGLDKEARGHAKEAETILRAFFPENYPLVRRAEALQK